jgi:hypothetical protein
MRSCQTSCFRVMTCLLPPWVCDRHDREATYGFVSSSSPSNGGSRAPLTPDVRFVNIRATRGQSTELTLLGGPQRWERGRKPKAYGAQRVPRG